MSVRVAVQERKRFLREGLAILLGDESDIEVIGAATTAAELLRLCDEHSPDVVLIELTADNWDSGPLVAALRADHPAIRIVGVGADHDGVNARLTRTDGLTAIVAALRSSARYESSADGSASTVPVVAVNQGLTARQIEILQHLCVGLTVNEISASLKISPKTVEHHKQRIFAQLGVHSQAQAVAVFLRTGTDAPAPAGTPVGAPEVTVRVVVADASQMIRDILRTALSKAGIEVVGDTDSIASLIELCRIRSPEVVVTGIMLDGRSLDSGLPHVLATGTRVLILSDGDAPEHLTALLLAGASGYVVLADTPLARVAEAVRTVARGEAALNSTVAGIILEQWRQLRATTVEQTAHGISLTPREREVLAAIADGLATKSIALRLGMATKTVENHKARIFGKLRARNQAHAVSAAIAAGLLTDEAGSRSGG